jgi:hypothetical protein
LAHSALSAVAEAKALLLWRGIAMPALPRRRRNPAVSTPSGAVSDARSIQTPSQLSLHARRCGAELAVAVAVEARGGPAIAAVALLAAAAMVVVLLRWLS